MNIFFMVKWIWKLYVGNKACGQISRKADTSVIRTTWLIPTDQAPNSGTPYIRLKRYFAWGQNTPYTMVPPRDCGRTGGLRRALCVSPSHRCLHWCGSRMSPLRGFGPSLGTFLSTRPWVRMSNSLGLVLGGRSTFFVYPTLGIASPGH
jgi:hypothetical protein